MKLLVPVDGSLASYNSAKKAVEIAKSYDSKIVLLTVLDDNIQRHNRNKNLWRQVDGSIISGLKSTADDNTMETELRYKGMELLDSLADELSFGEINVEKMVLFGEPYEMILETAKGIKADLIVIGNRGFSKIKRFFVGSVTQRVISEAPCPVLVIHTEAED